MATVSSVYLQNKSITLSLNNTYQNILTSVTKGLYIIFISLGGSIIAQLTLALGSGDAMLCVNKFLCGPPLGRTSGNTLTIPLYGTNNSSTVIFRFLSNTLSAKTERGNSLADVTFTCQLNSSENPGAITLSADTIQESTANSGTIISNELKVNSGIRYTVRTITADATLAATDNVILCNPSGVITEFAL